MRPFTLLIKPTGPDCNIACNYCFYAGKTCLFGQGNHRMSEDVLDCLIRSYTQLKFPVSSFAWQGGEPTLMGLDFYKTVVDKQKKYGSPRQVISNALQTNAILLDDNWCEFLSTCQFLVGISLDGPQQYHDAYRLDKNQKGTFDRVIKAIECCKKHKVEFNILVLLNNLNVQAPDELYDFFLKLDISYLQFVACVEKDLRTGQVMNFSITPEHYADFLCRVFDRWYESGRDKLSIRLFDSILSWIINGHHTMCTYSKGCNDYIVIEHNGDVFCCDFFVDQKFHLGNICETPIEQLAECETKRNFSRKKTNLHNQCIICRHKDICRGGCLKDRIIQNDEFSDKSYFCQTYKKFFDYSLPRFRQIAAELVTKNRNTTS